MSSDSNSRPLFTRQLSEEEKAQLSDLIERREEAKNNLKEWLDNKIMDLSRIKIGHLIFSIVTGEVLGVVSKIKRYDHDSEPGLIVNNIWYRTMNVLGQVVEVKQIAVHQLVLEEEVLDKFSVSFIRANKEKWLLEGGDKILEDFKVKNPTV